MGDTSVTDIIHDPTESGTLPTRIDELPWWCVHRAKVPYDPATGNRASVNDPATFGTREGAEAAYARGGYDGIGFLVNRSLDIVFIDIDHVVDNPGDPLPDDVLELITAADTYAERSPSGTGVHLIMRGTLGDHKNRTPKGAAIRAEAYGRGRFATYTGDHIAGTPDTFNDNPADLEALLDRLGFEHRAAAKQATTSPGEGLTLDDRELVERLRKESGGKAARLLDGDAGGYDSPSEAREALAYKCRFYGADAAQIARILRTYGPWSDGESDAQRDRRVKLDAKTAVESYTGPYYDPGRGRGLRFGGNDASDAGPDDPGEEEAGDDPDVTANPGVDGAAVRLGPSLAAGDGKFFHLPAGADPEPENFRAFTNFVAWIVAHVTEDDGAGGERAVLHIVGRTASGRAMAPVMVPADEFGKMGWITARGGPSWRNAVIEAGTTNRDRARAAIQHLSNTRGIAEQRRYTHTGWRKIDGQWFFLTSGGAIGPDGLRTDVDVSVDGGLERVALATVPDRDGLRDHGRAWLRVLELAPDRIIAPAVASVPRAILGELLPVDHAIFFHGRTGVFKSELVAILAAHFGRTLTRLTLPIGWESTANSIEAALHRLKDVVAVVDDFAPAGSRYQQDQQHGALERTLRGVGNHAGRGRLNADGSLRQTFTPRGLVMITGEEVPRGHSATARAQFIEIESGAISPAVLSECQALVAAGVFEELTAGFVAALARDWSRASEQVRAIHAGHLTDARAMGFGHARTGDVVAGQLTAVSIWFGYLASVGAVSKAEGAQYIARMRDGIMQAGHCQAGATDDVDPVTTFLDLTRAAIASEAAYLADKTTNGEPKEARRLGWRIEMIATRDSVQPVGKPQGRRIGWVDLDNDAAYLNPDAALAVVQDIGAKQGRTIPVSAKTLAKRIGERGLIASADAGRSLRKVYVAGGAQRVLHLRLSDLLPAGEEDSGEHVDPVPFDWSGEAAS